MWTPPLRELTPATSYGFGVIEFARDILRSPLDPWEEWVVIHSGELLPDGRPRFRNVLIIVARQNGKTHVAVVLTLYWLFVEMQPLILGTSTNLTYAKESWMKAVSLAQSNPELAPYVAAVRRAAGEEALITTDGCRYKIAASNRKGGRSLTINRLILDELREHDTFEAIDAALPAMNAVPDAQAIAITNQGDERAVVLKSWRESALEFIQTGEGDETLGLFEWSAPEGSDPEDIDALAQANPNLGNRVHVPSLLKTARRVKARGGEELAGFMTEIMCIPVPNLDPAIDMAALKDCHDPGELSVRSRLALCFDVALDMEHATLYAAAQLEDGRVRIEPVAAWEGPSCTQDLIRDLPKHAERIRPRKVGWLPNGPSAAVAAAMMKRPGEWPPKRVKVDEIRSELTAVCMGFAEQVKNRRIAHSDDPLLTSQAEMAEKSWRGDGWVFARRGAGHCDALYAASGAVHLARTMPARRRARIVSANTR